MGDHATKIARDDIKKNLVETVITKKNALNYKYIDSNKLDKKKFLKEKNKDINK